MRPSAWKTSAIFQLRERALRGAAPKSSRVISCLPAKDMAGTWTAGDSIALLLIWSEKGVASCYSEREWLKHAESMISGA